MHHVWDVVIRGPRVDQLDTLVLELPTEHQPETDGTATWSSTTMVLVQLHSDGASGLGYSYVDAGAARLIEDVLAQCVIGADVHAVPEIATRMLRAVRNHGRAGIAACAISAIDVALWDLRATLLELPLSRLLGGARDEVPVYASGGFTSTPLDELAREVSGYAAAGHRRVKIKIGRPVESAVERARVARAAAGPENELMVDGNGAYTAGSDFTYAPR